LIAIGLEKGDTLGWVRPTTGGDDAVLTTSDGQAIRFKETDVRPMGATLPVSVHEIEGTDKIVVWMSFRRVRKFGN